MIFFFGGGLGICGAYLKNIYKHEFCGGCSHGIYKSILLAYIKTYA